jgi:hypothetical protein
MTYVNSSFDDATFGVTMFTENWYGGRGYGLLDVIEDTPYTNLDMVELHRDLHHGWWVQ